MTAYGEGTYGEGTYGEGVGAITGEVASVTVTALSGSALTAISVAGSVATLAVSALDGTATSGPVTVQGAVASVAATALDGSALTAILIGGDVASLSAQANDGSTMLGPIPGSVAVVDLSALDGGVALDSATDVANVFNGRIRNGYATVELTVPVAAAASARGYKVDKAVPYPLPTLVNGRPT